MKECHIFIAITNKVGSNKMIAIRRRTFIIKVLFFILLLAPFIKNISEILKRLSRPANIAFIIIKTVFI